MSDENYKMLVERYADGRKLCNCGKAYRGTSGQCDYGCSANQIFAKYEIADSVVAEFGLSNKPAQSPVLFRQHRGSLHESMKTVVTVHSRQEILDQFEPWLIGVPAGEKPDVSKMAIEKTMYDERIGWDTHLVTYEGAGVLGQTNGPLPEDAGISGEDGDE